MSAWLLSALDRMSPGMRRAAVVSVALLSVGAVLAALTLSAASLGPPSRRSPRSPPAKEPFAQRSSWRLPAPVSSARLDVARRVAVRFLDGYLQLAYGRAAMVPRNGVTPVVGRQLAGERAEITPAERRRHPRVVLLQVIGMTPGFVVATATVSDGGVTAYRLRLTLQPEAGGWAVSGVGEG